MAAAAACTGELGRSLVRAGSHRLVTIAATAAPRAAAPHSLRGTELVAAFHGSSCWQTRGQSCDQLHAGGIPLSSGGPLPRFDHSCRFSSFSSAARSKRPPHSDLSRGRVADGGPAAVGYPVRRREQHSRIDAEEGDEDAWPVVVPRAAQRQPASEGGDGEWKGSEISEEGQEGHRHSRGDGQGDAFGSYDGGGDSRTGRERRTRTVGSGSGTDAPPTPTPSAAPMRLARWLARSAALESRRVGEAAIAAGRVRVNGQVVSSPAYNVTPGSDRVTLDGKPLPTAARPVELFLMHKLAGELVSRTDPEGRSTIYDRLRAMGLPAGLKPVGRLDFTTEGLLLLTNDGDVARFLENPASGIERTYRLRVYGHPALVESAAAAFRRGARVEGVQYRPAGVRVLSTEEASRHHGEKQPRGSDSPPVDTSSVSMREAARLRQAEAEEAAAAAAGGEGRARGEGGAGQQSSSGSGGHAMGPRQNAWLEVVLTEGKNREVRRIAEAHGLSVNRLIRVGYGPYSLSRLGRGDVLQVARVPQWIQHCRPQRSQYGDYGVQAGGGGGANHSGAPHTQRRADGGAPHTQRRARSGRDGGDGGAAAAVGRVGSYGTGAPAPAAARGRPSRLSTSWEGTEE